MNVIEQANRIKARLRDATSEVDIETIANEERALVERMSNLADGKPLAIQIRNLKNYRLRQLRGN